MSVSKPPSDEMINFPPSGKSITLSVFNFPTTLYLNSSAFNMKRKDLIL